MMQNSGGIKYYKAVQIFQKLQFRGSKYFSKIEINYLGVQIFRYIWTGGTKKNAVIYPKAASRCLATIT